MVHIKDLKASTKPNFALAMDPTEIGAGSLDWKAILATAYATGVRGYFVEQEAPFAFPRLQSAKIDHDYLASVVA
jgi:sugar phosphate isomerase/epimerase